MKDPQGILEQALAEHQAGRLERATGLYRELLRRAPEHPDALHLLGVARHQQGHHDEAASLIRKALHRDPLNTDYRCNLASVLRAAGDPVGAEEAARAALGAAPRLAAGHNALGGALRDQGRFEEALTAFETATREDPRLIEARCNLAGLTLDTGDTGRARPVVESLMNMAPRLPLVHGLAGQLAGLEARETEAVAHWQRAAALDPGDPALCFGLATSLETVRRWDEALECYLRALALDPGMSTAVNGALFMARATCDWSRYAELSARFARDLEEEREGLSPFLALAEPLTSRQQLRCARTWSREKIRRAGAAAVAAPPPRPGRVGERITIAYVTSEFRRHPTAYTKVGLFEHHDRERFRVVGYCNGEDDGSDIRARIVAAVDEFVDLRGYAPAAAAARMRADAPDILIDLKGHTQNAMTEALAHRPAPVQATWVGFPGSTGAPFIDYAIVDPIVAPATADALFSEQLVRLPETYWAEDSGRARPAPAPGRSECGLPEDAVVLACFNNSYKLQPETFDFWMELLRDLPETVLWLQDSNPNSRLKNNLRREAQTRQVAPERLVFCPRLPLEDYLARYRVADLFIDTLPYNAHTTLADALWAGLPAVTLPGETMASRVAASLLNAAGLADLVCADRAAYGALIRELVRQPERRARLRDRVTREVAASVLFDTARFTRHFEAGITAMVERSRSGLPPAPILVPRLPD